MKKQELLDLGFIPESDCSKSLHYSLIEDDENTVYLQVCPENKNIYPSLVISQYNWVDMVDNSTYLPMPTVNTIEALKEAIKKLTELFTI